MKTSTPAADPARRVWPPWLTRWLPFHARAPAIELPEGIAAVQVVGDIHGRMDLLDAMLRRLDRDAPIVFVGDYIDRGPASRDVLLRLHELDRSEGVTCLTGNHEIMLLGFLLEPDTAGAAWMRNGGQATLRSFGLDPADDFDVLRDALCEALGPELIGWLGRLPALARFGNLAVVHAGADPRRAIEAQSRETLTWGHPDFMRRTRRDGLWIAHGHTIVDRPEARSGRISIDTGAFRSDRLTAAIVRSGPAANTRFISPSPDMFSP